MTSIVKWAILKISLKLINIMPIEALMFVESKWDSSLIIPMYIINIFMDLST
jgi:hypothetical protein